MAPLKEGMESGNHDSEISSVVIKKLLAVTLVRVVEEFHAIIYPKPGFCAEVPYHFPTLQMKTLAISSGETRSVFHIRPQ